MQDARILSYTLNLSAWNSWNYLSCKSRLNSAVNEAINATILTALKDVDLDHPPQVFRTKCSYFKILSSIIHASVCAHALLSVGKVHLIEQP